MTGGETVRAAPLPAWVRGLALAAAAVVVASALVNLAYLLFDADQPPTVARLISPRAQYGVPALVTSVIEVVAGLFALSLAFRELRAGRRATALAWCFLGLIAVLASVGDLTHLQDRVVVHGTDRTALLIAGWAAFLCAGLVAGWSVLALPGARWRWVAVLLLVISNPLTENWKDSLRSDPDNYAFVAMGLPARFNDDAWQDLRGVELLQETSESAAALLALLVAGSALGRAAGRREQ